MTITDGTDPAQTTPPGGFSRREVNIMRAWVRDGRMLEKDFERITGRAQKLAPPASVFSMEELEAAMEVSQDNQATKRQWLTVVGPISYEMAKHGRNRAAIQNWIRSRIELLREQGVTSTGEAKPRRRGRRTKAEIAEAQAQQARNELTPEQLDTRLAALAKGRASLAEKREAQRKQKEAAGVR